MWIMMNSQYDMYLKWVCWCMVYTYGIWIIGGGEEEGRREREGEE